MTTARNIISIRTRCLHLRHMFIPHSIPISKASRHLPFLNLHSHMNCSANHHKKMPKPSHTFNVLLLVLILYVNNNCCIYSVSASVVPSRNSESASILSSRKRMDNHNTQSTVRPQDKDGIFSTFIKSDIETIGTTFITTPSRGDAALVPKRICETSRCAAKVIVRSRKWIRDSTITAAVSILRTRSGFRTVFRRNWWFTHRERVRRKGTMFWEAIFTYRVTGGSSEIDAVAPPDQALSLADGPVLLPDEASTLAEQPVQVADLSSGETI